ncbi:MAG: hypothetical protein N2578_02185 [Bdellovibrionaceae bacterium]|nr:hypothetical protein [Pseudobdellovibrionaceae bacterium]
MKSIFAVLLSIFIASCTTVREPVRKRISQTDARGVPLEGGGLKKRILVLPFIDPTNKRPSTILENSRKAFIMDLNRSGEVIAIDSTEMRVDPKKALKGSEYDLKQLAKEVSDLGVSTVLEGSLLDIRVRNLSDRIGLIRKMRSAFEVEVRVRLLSLRGSREIFNTVKTVTLEQDNVRVAERVETDRFIEANPELIQIIVKDAFLDFTPQILAALAKVTWEGRIAALSGDRVYLNVGRVSGVQIGDILKVTDEGEDVFDPESGQHIGKVPGRQKGTLEVISYFGVDGSIAIIHSGAGFKENDRVELY